MVFVTIIFIGLVVVGVIYGIKYYKVFAAARKKSQMEHNAKMRRQDIADRQAANDAKAAKEEREVLLALAAPLDDDEEPNASDTDQPEAVAAEGEAAAPVSAYVEAAQRRLAAASPPADAAYKPPQFTPASQPYPAANNYIAKPKSLFAAKPKAGQKNTALPALPSSHKK